MRFPYRSPRCGDQLYIPANYNEGGKWWSTTHTCGLRAGHKAPHGCRKHTCRAVWRGSEGLLDRGGAA